MDSLDCLSSRRDLSPRVIIDFNLSWTDWADNTLHILSKLRPENGPKKSLKQLIIHISLPNKSPIAYLSLDVHRLFAVGSRRISVLVKIVPYETVQDPFILD